MQHFTPLEYIKISVASSFGLDKENWDVRLDWFNSHEHHLFDMVQHAEEPAKMFAGINAYYDALKGKPSGFTVAIDATASVFQIMACLTGDIKAAKICNLVDTGKREDSYTAVYNFMLEHDLAPAHVSRKQAKSAVMTSLYGSIKEPIKVFGSDNVENFYKTMSSVAPAVWSLNKLFLKLWDSERSFYEWVLPNNFNVTFKVKDTVTEQVAFRGKMYDVSYKEVKPKANGRALGPHCIHSIDGMVDAEMITRCNYDKETIALMNAIVNFMPIFNEPTKTKEDDEMVITLWNHYRNSGFLSARIFDHLSSTNVHLITDISVVRNLLNSLPNKPFEVLSVFDCFSCLPNHVDDLRVQYNNILAEIADSNLLNYILTQILGTKTTVEKVSDNLSEYIRECNYSLC